MGTIGRDGKINTELNLDVRTPPTAEKDFLLSSALLPFPYRPMSGLNWKALAIRMKESLSWLKPLRDSRPVAVDEYRVNAFFDEVLRAYRVENWDSQTDKSGWPHRPCVRIFKTDGSCLVTYFGISVHLVKHQFAALLFYSQWAQKHQGPAPDHKLEQAGVTYGDLAPIMCRIRSAFRLSTQKIKDAKIRQAANELVRQLFPAKRPGIGYFIGHPNLIQII